jgi:hypothetical protein
VAYELLKQVNAFALEALKSAPRTATDRAIFFMMEHPISKSPNEWGVSAFDPYPTTPASEDESIADRNGGL